MKDSEPTRIPVAYNFLHNGLPKAAPQLWAIRVIAPIKCL